MMMMMMMMTMIVTWHSLFVLNFSQPTIRLVIVCKFSGFGCCRLCQIRVAAGSCRSSAFSDERPRVWPAFGQSEAAADTAGRVDLWRSGPAESSEFLRSSSSWWWVTVNLDNVHSLLLVKKKKKNLFSARKPKIKMKACSNVKRFWKFW